MSRGAAGAAYGHAELPFPDLATTRRMAGISYGGSGGAGRRQGAEARPDMLGINGTRADVRGRMAAASGGKRAARSAAGSSGPQRHSRGEWIGNKWKIRRGFAGARMLVGAGACHITALRPTG